MGKKHDDDAPEWTEADFKKARRLKDVHPEMVTALKALRGRPPVDHPKRQLTVRLDPALIDAIKATGRGYNARIEKALREALDKGKL